MSEFGTYLSRVPRFEPPISKPSPSADAAATHAQCRPARPTSASRRTAHGGRSPRAAGNPTVPAAEPDPELSEAHRFTEHTLRLTLEVLDRRRAPAQLRPLLSGPLVDLVRALQREAVPGRSLGAATLQRIHLRALHADAAEVFGTYARGTRIFAIAARIERGATARHPSGWVVTSLRIA